MTKKNYIVLDVSNLTTWESVHEAQANAESLLRQNPAGRFVVYESFAEVKTKQVFWEYHRGVVGLQPGFTEGLKKIR